MRQFMIAVALLCMLGCNQERMLQQFTSPSDQAEARQYIDCLRGNKLDEIEKVTDPSIQGSNLRATLTNMARLIPNEEPSSVKLVGAQLSYGPNGTAKNLTFEYDFSGKWFLINVATQDKAGTATLVGLNVYPQAKSLEELNRFSLTGKSSLHYFVVAFAVCVPLFTFYALLACLRTKISRRKWLWVLFIILGFGRFALNWSTGDWQISLVSFQLFSASAFAQPYGPWFVSVSLPVGALLFLIRRRSFTVRSAS
jgi:hypothetical protein